MACTEERDAMAELERRRQRMTGGGEASRVHEAEKFWASWIEHGLWRLDGGAHQQRPRGSAVLVCSKGLGGVCLTVIVVILVD